MTQVKMVQQLTQQLSASKGFAKTKAILNQVVADLYTAHIALHQVHWYMRGAGFMVWHPKWMNTWKLWIQLWMKSEEALDYTRRQALFYVDRVYPTQQD